MVRNVFLIGEHLEIIQHLARQTNGYRLDRSLDPRVELDFDAVLLREVEVIRGVVRAPELSLIRLSLEFFFLFNLLEKLIVAWCPSVY